MGSRCRNNRDASKSIDAAFPMVKDTGAPFRKFVQMRGSAHGCRVWGGNRRYDSPASAYHWLLASSGWRGGHPGFVGRGRQSIHDRSGGQLSRSHYAKRTIHTTSLLSQLPCFRTRAVTYCPLGSPRCDLRAISRGQRDASTDGQPPIISHPAPSRAAEDVSPRLLTPRPPPPSTTASPSANP